MLLLDQSLVRKLYDVIETEQFKDSARTANVSYDEMQSIVSALAVNPSAGQLMRVTWGARTFRYKSWSAGRSRRYRIVTYCAGSHMPVFLIDIFAEGEKLSFSQAERERLSWILKQVAAAYKRGSE